MLICESENQQSEAESVNPMRQSVNQRNEFDYLKY